MPVVVAGDVAGRHLGWRHAVFFKTQWCSFSEKRQVASGGGVFC
jgi:hypothetical protein